MLKLMTWNCQGAFRKKYPLVASLAPDLAVIQECECLERIPWKLERPPTSTLWFGDGPNKGLGVFSWTNLTFEVLADYDHSLRYCIPIRVTAPYQFQLIAVWAMDHKINSHSYSAQVYGALGAYREFIQAADTVVIGDYNSSKRTTPRSRLGNHATLTLDLNDLWLVSAYHQFYFEHQGQEKRWTYFRGRKIDRHAHIDYVYIPSRWTRRLANVQVGDPKGWLEHSDHCPVIVEVQAKTPTEIV
jgi:exodeoxyribonuclease III